VARLIDLVLAHRWVVVLVWLVLAGSGAATAGRTVDGLSYSFGLPGQPAYEANTDIVEAYGGGGLDDPLVLTVAARDGVDLRAGRGLDAFDEATRQVARASPRTRVVLASDDPDVLVSADGGRAVSVLYPAVVPGGDPYVAALPRLQRAVAGADVLGSPLRLTGVPLLAEGGGSDRGILVEVVFGAAGAHRADRRLVRGAVPRRPDRPGRGHRLLAADRDALA
jgi:RND superfamily putative drug exporter